MNNNELHQLLTNLMMNLNAIPDNKHFRKWCIKRLISSTKKEIKCIINKKSYNAYDIYKFLLFIDIANTLNLFDRPKNIHYTCYKSNNVTEVSSGILSVSINYDNHKTLEVHFKPIMELDKSKIDMEWIISDNNPTPVDFKTVHDYTQMYSSTVDSLVDRKVNPTESISQTKILEYSSCGILYQAFLVCTESIFNRIEMRYLDEKK